MTWGTGRRTLQNRMMSCGILIICAFVMSGCATTVIGGLTVSQLSTIAGAASTATTGRGLQDHALSAVTGRDCRLLEGIIRAGRKICEEPGSAATEDDFRGFVRLFTGPQEDPGSEDVGEPTILYAGLESDFRPSLTRQERRSAAVHVPLQYAGDVPSILDWASAQPEPDMLTTASYSN